MSQETPNESSDFQSAKQPQIFSIEQINGLLRGLIDTSIGTIWLRGEISNFKPHSSGHFYFSLKDSKAQIGAMMFRGYNSKLRFKPHDGLEVIVRGKISIYEPRGTYSIACESMEPVGAGALQKQFEQLRDQLKAEGLFDASRKKIIPPYPKKIAIVTSPTGAALQDILNILSRRARSVEVIVVPALVQGEAAASSLIEAFSKAEQIKPDVIIIGRGGGSIEDMWCFNNEKLARLIAAATTPVISAVGHEIDFTICDFVSDLRAPTPSAAAELVAKSSHEIIQKLEQLDRMLKLALQKRLQLKQQGLLLFSKRLIDPKKKLQDLAIRNDDLYSRLDLAWQNYIQSLSKDILLLKSKLASPEQVIQKRKYSLQNSVQKISNLIQNKIAQKKYEVSKAMSLMDSFSPLKVVDRGYTIATLKETDKKARKVLKSVGQVQAGDTLVLTVTDGEIEAKVNATLKKVASSTKE